MNAMNLPPNPPHGHLDSDALWDMAEALAFKGAAGVSRETPRVNSAVSFEKTLAEAKACPVCAPKLEAAIRQIAALHAMPEIKAPPDFLLLVQKRIEAEDSNWKRIAATLRGWVMPRRAVGVPMGFASALLLVVVLVVILPQDEIEEKIGPVVALQDAPVPKAEQEPDRSQVANATQPTVVNEGAASQIKDSDHKQLPREKKGKVKRLESQVSTAPAGASAPPSSAPPPAAPEMHAKPARSIGQFNSAVSKEKPQQPAAARSLSKMAEAQEMPALAELESVADEVDAKNDAPIREKKSESLHRSIQAREVLAQKWLQATQKPLTRRGDTLVFEGKQDQAKSLKHLVDSLGLTSKAEFEFRGDSLYFKLSP